MTPAEAERLIKLAEESAELCQACMKALHHGLHATYDNGETNIQAVEREIGDVRAIISMMVTGGEVSYDKIAMHESRKRDKVLQFSYFQPGSQLRPKANQ